jgi:hypothetical protein
MLLSAAHVFIVEFLSRKWGEVLLSGIRVNDMGLRVEDLGLRVIGQGLGIRVESLGLGIGEYLSRASGLRCMVYWSGFGVRS